MSMMSKVKVVGVCQQYSLVLLKSAWGSEQRDISSFQMASIVQSGLNTNAKCVCVCALNDELAKDVGRQEDAPQLPEPTMSIHLRSPYYILGEQHHQLLNMYPLYNPICEILASNLNIQN